MPKMTGKVTAGGRNPQPQVSSRNMQNTVEELRTRRSEKRKLKSRKPTSAQPSTVHRRSGSRRNSATPPLSVPHDVLVGREENRKMKQGIFSLIWGLA
nr:hypothetical protein Itr_chr14CG16750 [Ipomoea trifida]